MPKQLKILVRREVQLYTLMNFFAEVGGYLVLLLGESLISYIIIITIQHRTPSAAHTKGCPHGDRFANN